MSGADIEFVLRLLLATGCGLLIGLERQYRSRIAGLRTHVLVAAGASVFVLFGVQADVPIAPLQITAYVVSGVGFLGGGVILRQGFSVQGLNTAATLWCCAAVGCQAAAGHVIPALATTAVVLGVHLLLRPMGRLVDRAPAANDEAVSAYTIVVVIRRKHELKLRARLLQALTEPDITLRGLSSQTEIDDAADDIQLSIEVLIEGNPATRLDALVTRLSLEPGVRSVSWRAEDSDPRAEEDRDEAPAIPLRGRARRDRLAAPMISDPDRHRVPPPPVVPKDDQPPGASP